MSIAALERPSPTARAGRHALQQRPPSVAARASTGGREPFDDLSLVFPAGRPCGAGDRAPARRRPGLDPLASATAWLLQEGLGRLDAQQRRRVLRHWHAVRHHGVGVVGDGGCDVRLGPRGIGVAEREALLAWLPLTQRDLAVYDGGLFEDAPAHAIALLVRPPTIWSLEEARRAERLFPRGPRFDPRRFAAIESYASERIGVGHADRLRRAVGWIAAQLPVLALPVASATVTLGCVLVAADEARARAVVARQLARYASSALVAASMGADR